MSTVTSQATASTAPTTTAPTTQLTFGGVLRSEWIKLRTLRSTLWCYVILVILTIGLGLLIASSLPTTTQVAPHDLQQSTWVTVTTLGIGFAQLVSAVLGALVITGEYGTGMIRSTFAAVPKRLPAVVAKGLVFGLTTFVVTFVALVATALLTAPLLPDKGITPDFGDADVWVALVGGAGYVALIGLLAFAIGLILRNSAGGIAAALGLILVVPIIFQVLAAVTGADWPANILAFLPSNAGALLYAYPGGTVDVSPDRPPGGGGPAEVVSNVIVLEAWQGLLVLVGWFAATFAAGVVLLNRRDA